MKTNFERVPPQSIEFEESILSSCLVNNSNIGDAIDIVFPEDFYRGSHQEMFRAMTRMYRTQTPVDAGTLMQYLRDMNKLEQVGGAIAISKILDMPTAVDFDHTIKKVREKAALRETIQICNAVEKRCYTDQNDADGTLEFFQQKANEITMYGGKGEIFGIRDLVLTAGERYDELWNNRGSVTGVETGYRMMDHLLGGLQPGLIVLAARPSMGKTALCVDILKNGARSGSGGLMFSMEQGEDEVTDRVIAGEAKVNLLKFRTGQFEKDDWPKIENAKAKIAGWPIHIDPTGGLTVAEIKRRARQYVRFNPEIKLIIIDYLQLIKGPKSENRNHEIGEITRGLKELSKELKMPVLLLSQLNRMLESRPNPNKRPRMSDLRDSGNIEQDADVIMFIYRPEVYNDTSLPYIEGQADIDIAKHRNGPTGMFSTVFKQKHTRFYDIEETPDREPEYERQREDRQAV